MCILILADKSVKELSLQVEAVEARVCRILKQLQFKKGLCQVGSEDVDGCLQRYPENSVHRTFLIVREWCRWLSCKNRTGDEI